PLSPFKGGLFLSFRKKRSAKSNEPVIPRSRLVGDEGSQPIKGLPLFSTSIAVFPFENSIVFFSLIQRIVLFILA
ncbi:MAG TPA: hypothetical protein VE868_06015, partial [Balneolaceae bacterium]|nr:hypothetical protein [Balneolaceae bacterium]